MFLEESSLGRQHWRQNLALLLQRLASTLHWVLQGQPAPGSTWGYLAIKVRATAGSGEGSVPARTGQALQQCPEGCNALSCFEWLCLGHFSEVRNTDHPCGTSCSSRPASRSSRHCQRTWPPWCGAHQERVRPCRASWDCCWRWLGGRCVQPWEGWSCLSQGAKQCCPSQVLSPFPSPRQACRDSPVSGMAERPHVAACRGS